MGEEMLRAVMFQIPEGTFGTNGDDCEPAIGEMFQIPEGTFGTVLCTRGQGLPRALFQIPEGTFGTCFTFL